MELLNKQLVNKENQFREMSTQLLSHIKKVDSLTLEIQALESANEVLKSLLLEKDLYLSNLLSEKLEYCDILEELENPSQPEFLQQIEHASQDLPKSLKIEPKEEKKKLDMSDDITQELSNSEY